MKFCSLSTLLLGALALVSCGDRSDNFDVRVTSSAEVAVGLNEAVAIVDTPLDRVVFLQGTDSGGLRRSNVRVGKNPVSLRRDVGGDRLLVLSSGVQPRLRPDDELPSLTVIETTGRPSVEAQYELTDQFENVTLDPEGQWAVLAGLGDSDSVVSNPNQLVLIDLSEPDFVPVTKTIRSFGAAPERFFFTPPLDVNGTERRFLVVETSQDIALVDLSDLDAPEVTIGLPQRPDGQPGRPAQVVVHPGVDEVAGDARLAIRLAGDSSLEVVTFAPDEDDADGFNLTLNLVDVGAPAGAIEFVQTDDGVRLAALVPSRQEAILVDPVATRLERVSLPSGFNQIRQVDGEEAEGDVALLWADNGTQVGFWSLGRTAERAFRSVDVLDLDASIRSVLDVPGDTLNHRKLVQSRDNRFFVLDLESRQSYPMFSRNSSESMSLRVATDGLRAWAFDTGSVGFAQVDLETLEPTSLSLERSIRNLFDIGIDNSTKRALIALHPGGALGATVLDAREPDTASTRFFPGLLLGGIQ